MSNATSSVGALPAPRKAGAAQALILVFTTQLPIMGLLSLIPIIPLLAQQFSTHPSAHFLVPLLITAPSACIALLSPLAGILADRFGRRRLLLIAVFFYGVFGFAPYFMDDLVSVVACRFVLGVTEAVIMTVANTLFGDFYEPGPRRKWLAVQSGVGSVSGAVLMFSGGLLGEMGWQGPFLLYLLAFPIFLGLLFWTWEPGRKQQEASEPSGEPFPLGRMALVVGVTLLAATLYYVEVLQISQILHGIGLHDSSKLGLASGLANMGVPLGALVFAWLSKRDIRLQLATVFLLFSAGLIGLGLAVEVNFAVFSAFIAQVGCGLLIPALINWCLSGLSFEHRGRGVGLWTAAFFIGQFVSPFLVTLVGTPACGLAPAVLIMGYVALVALVVTGLLAIRRATARPPLFN
ncbi:MFS transporter [Pseudomonas sp. BNK-43-a]|uniref:MFS transporter n=1 Tax=unclassified Pseudomonas TaxID=196821 RepID=UPI0039BF9FFF